MNDKSDLEKRSSEKLPQILVNKKLGELKVDKAWENIEFTLSLITDPVRDYLKETGRTITLAPSWKFLRSSSIGGMTRVYIDSDGSIICDDTSEGDTPSGWTPTLTKERLEKVLGYRPYMVEDLAGLSHEQIVKKIKRAIK